MSGPKCYRYTVDRAHLQRQIEAERQRREVQQHQQAIAQAHTEWASLTQMLTDLRQRYPGETIPLNLKTPPAPPLETGAVDAVRNYRDALSQHLAQARADLQHISDRAAANATTRNLLAELSQAGPVIMRSAAEALQADDESAAVQTDRQAEWQRLVNRLNDRDQRSPPSTLMALRDAFLNAASEAQTRALAAELRHHIQLLNNAHAAVVQQHLQQEEQEAARGYAQQVISETLHELGYTVETGFATLFVAGGVAHIHQPDWGDYRVRMRVKPEVGDLNFNVVRVSTDHGAGSTEQAQRDRAMEESWCEAHEELLRRLQERGIASQRTRALAPGAWPVPIVKLEAVAVEPPAQGQRRRRVLTQRQRVID